jgi:predicted nucleotidyltransferase
MNGAAPSSPEALTAALTACLAAHPRGIVAAYLFGSQARGSAHAKSDVDVGLLLETTPKAFVDLPLDLEGELERTAHKPTQVVVLNQAPVDLVHRVLRDGILLFEADRSARIAFETRARAEFFDLEPYLERYRRARQPACPMRPW